MNEDFDYNNMKFRYEKENLSDIFMTMVDTYPCVANPKVSGQINLWELFQEIKYNMTDDVALDPIINPKYVDGRKNPVYDKNKIQLPTICYNANFNTYKDIEHLIAPTNLMFLDIDDFNTKEEALAYKNYITLRYDWIVACNISLSRLGLHVIIRVDKIHNNDDYNYKYDFISKVYFNEKLDKNGKSLTRYTVVPFDYNIYINETPNVLNIEHLIKNNDKGICSGYKEKSVISTGYTFSTPSQLNPILNDSARLNGLVFKQYLDESLFLAPDIPIYYPEGRDVIKFNVRPYHDRKVKDGMRTYTVGGLTVRLIYLNAKVYDRKDSEVKEAILRCIVGINKEICDPPLSYKEVLNSFNANWKKYEDDELDFSKYYEKQRSFWSRECTLKGNEKRKVTCRIKNEPVVAESKRTIKEAIELIKASGEKVTQKKVALVSGLSLPTIKKYRNYYKEVILESNSIIIKRGEVTTIDDINPVDHEIASYSDALEARNEPAYCSFSRDITFKESEIAMDIEKVGNIIFDPVAINPDDSRTILSGDQYRIIFERVYNSFKNRLNEDDVKELFTKFMEKFSQMAEDDAVLLAKPIDSIKDSDTFFKQAALDSKFWNLLPTL